MSKYKFDKNKKPLPDDAEISKYKDFGKLVHNYQRATKPLYHKPLYKQPKVFIFLVMIVLLALLITHFADKEEQQKPVPQEQQK
jgi:energy-converting hydrogenase Eha subunit F